MLTGFSYAIYRRMLYLKPMDLGNIVYIVAVIAYFIYQATKKKRSAEEEGELSESEAQPERGVSFEDLLREIRDTQQGKTTTRPVKEIPKPVIVEKSVSEPEQKSLYKSQEEYDDEIKHYKGAFDYRKPELAKISAGIPDIPSVIPEAYETKSKQKNRYADMLKNPSTVKDAVVLKEILDRKYI